VPNDSSLLGFVHLASRDHRMTHADGTPPGPPAARRPRARVLLRRLVARVRHLLCLWRRSIAESDELRAMSDRELRDMGISRYDAEHAAKQAFWRNSAGRL
jgi:uncharacterized protein YjiS (DUF1127 family)